MVKTIFIVLAIAVLPMTLQATEVTFVLDNLKNNQGAVRVGIYSSEETFLKEGQYVTGCSTKGALSGRKARTTCEISPGTYAAAVYHDENDNKKLDTNFIGIPEEGYGFSNNARGSLGLPKFENAAFTVGEKPLEMKIDLTY